MGRYRILFRNRYRVQHQTRGFNPHLDSTLQWSSKREQPPSPKIWEAFFLWWKVYHFKGVSTCLQNSTLLHTCPATLYLVVKILTFIYTFMIFSLSGIWSLWKLLNSWVLPFPIPHCPWLFPPTTNTIKTWDFEIRGTSDDNEVDEHLTLHYLCLPPSVSVSTRMWERPQEICFTLVPGCLTGNGTKRGLEKSSGKS